ncbi:preprotein translocase subunit SecY [Candidatus Saccharibacteria bacterium]|nr:MAG: preprotein translocase subunit SecY [Candidatus Saccharibacteria bacterium]
MNWKLIFQSLKHGDMRKRLLAVMGMILIFRVLAQIPIPIGNGETLKQLLENLFTASQGSSLLGFLNVLSGGALSRFSIVLLGLGPFINASIIMQLLTQAIPKLEALNKEGEFGRKKINQYTRLLAFPLAIIQSVGAIYLVQQTATQVAGVGSITAGASPLTWFVMVGALTAGSMLLMWLGEIITEQGVGNGISLLITAGIVSSLPSTIASIGSALFTGSDTTRIFGITIKASSDTIITVGVIAFVTVLLTYFVVKLNEAARKITIHYAKRVQGNRTYGGVTTILPVKLITAGVIPIIFALAFLSVPAFAGQLLTTNSSARLAELGANLSLWFQNPSAQTFAQGGWIPYIYPITYFFLVFVFTYFYTSITFNTKEIAENLQKQGGFIEGVRTGNSTEKHLKKTINRLTFFGALALGFLAIVPIIGQVFLNTSISLGGTSILILVAVSLETLRAIESRALMVTYDDYSRPDFFYGETEKSSKKRFNFLKRKKK